MQSYTYPHMMRNAYSRQYTRQDAFEEAPEIELESPKTRTRNCSVSAATIGLSVRSTTYRVKSFRKSLSDSLNPSSVNTTDFDLLTELVTYPLA